MGHTAAVSKFILLNALRLTRFPPYFVGLTPIGNSGGGGGGGGGRWGGTGQNPVSVSSCGPGASGGGNFLSINVTSHSGKYYGAPLGAASLSPAMATHHGTNGGTYLQGTQITTTLTPHVKGSWWTFGVDSANLPAGSGGPASNVTAITYNPYFEGQGGPGGDGSCVLRYLRNSSKAGPISGDQGNTLLTSGDFIIQSFNAVGTYLFTFF